MMATSGQKADMSKLLKEWPWGKGTRTADGIYQVPGQHVHDGLRLSAPFLPSELDRIKESLEFNEQDVISSGFVKTGSTWVNEIIFLICNNVDMEKCDKLTVFEKMTFLEFNITGEPKMVDTIEAMPSPRLIKSHLPARYYQRNINKRERGPKVVISMRNPKDTLVSFFHFYRMNPELGMFDGEWDEFFELFRNEQLTYEDMFKFNVDWWALRDHPNVHIVMYEDLKKDPATEITKMSASLGYTLTPEQVQTIVEGTSFEAMKKRGAQDVFFVSKEDPNKNFFRKGKVGGWRGYFSDEQSSYVDKLCGDMSTPVGLSFEF